MTRSPVLALVCALTIAAQAFGQSSPPQTKNTPLSVTAAVRAELLKARAEIWHAWFANDRAVLEALLPEHVIAINNGDTTWQNRAAVLQSAAAFAREGGKLVRLEFPRTEFQVYGDVAILYSLVEFELEQGGKRHVQRGRATEVFIKKGRQWLNSGWHIDSGS